MTESDAVWLAAFRKDILPGILTQQGSDAACYAVAQLATVHANGRLLYHEGRARIKIGQNREYHAWNTLKGETVDFRPYNNLPDPNTVAIDYIHDDVLSVPASEVYDRYEPEREYPVEQVRAKLKERSGALYWFEVPPNEARIVFD